MSGHAHHQADPSPAPGFWRSRSGLAFIAFGIVAAISLLSGWLQMHWPEVRWFNHDAGHLPEMMPGPGINPHFGPFHVLSTALIIGGFWMVAAAWQAQVPGWLPQLGAGASGAARSS